MIRSTFISFWLAGAGILAVGLGASCSVRHNNNSTTSAASTSGGGGEGSGQGGASATAGGGGAAPTAKDLFTNSAGPCLITACGGCHKTQGISDIYFLGDGTLPSAYIAITTYPGVTVADPTMSKIITHPDGNHGFTDLPGPNWMDVAKSDPTCKPAVLAWLQKESDELPKPSSDAGLVQMAPFKPHLGAFNTIYLDELGADFKDASISFLASEAGSAPLLLQLTSIEVHPVQGKPLHVVHPLFTVYNPDATMAPDPDPIDNFSGLDEKFDVTGDPALGTGALTLINWVEGARLGIAFEKIELAQGATPPEVSCVMPALFKSQVAPVMQYCADNCHGGLGDPAMLLPNAKAQMDLSQLVADPLGTCVKVRAWIKAGDPDTSQILLNTNPKGGSSHMYKFKGNYGNPMMPAMNSYLYFKGEVTPWINAEKTP